MIVPHHYSYLGETLWGNDYPYFPPIEEPQPPHIVAPQKGLLSIEVEPPKNAQKASILTIDSCRITFKLTMMAIATLGILGALFAEPPLLALLCLIPATFGGYFLVMHLLVTICETFDRVCTRRH